MIWLSKNILKLMLMLVQHIRKYLPELLSLISELWSSFNFPSTIRPPLGYPVSMFCHLLFFILFLLGWGGGGGVGGGC